MGIENKGPAEQGFLACSHPWPHWPTQGCAGWSHPHSSSNVFIGSQGGSRYWRRAKLSLIYDLSLDLILEKAFGIKDKFLFQFLDISLYDSVDGRLGGVLSSK